MTSKNTLQAHLYHNNNSVACCEVHYLGLLGVQVKTGPLSYPNGTHLEVKLIDTQRKDTHQCRLPAVITNISKEDIGLTFLNHDMKTNVILLDMILSMGVHAATT